MFGMTEFAVYKGDEFQFIGTFEECAQRMGIKEQTFYYYLTDAYKRKVEKRGTKNPIIVLKLEEEVTC